MTVQHSAAELQLIDKGFTDAVERVAADLEQLRDDVSWRAAYDPVLERHRWLARIDAVGRVLHRLIEGDQFDPPPELIGPPESAKHF